MTPESQSEINLGINDKGGSGSVGGESAAFLQKLKRLGQKVGNFFPTVNWDLRRFLHLEGILLAQPEESEQQFFDSIVGDTKEFDDGVVLPKPDWVEKDIEYFRQQTAPLLKGAVVFSSSKGTKKKGA